MYPIVDFCCGCCKDAFIESGAESSDASKWSQLLTCVLLRTPCQLYQGGGGLAELELASLFKSLQHSVQSTHSMQMHCRHQYGTPLCFESLLIGSWYLK